MFRYRRQPKITVDIIYSDGTVKTKKYPIKYDKIIIKEGKAGRGKRGWTPSFTRPCVLEVQKGRIIKRKHKKVMLREDADSCVNFDPKLPKPDTAKWSKYTMEKWGDKEVVDKSGNIKIKHELPTVFWLLLLMVGSVFIFQMLGLMGVRIG